MPGSRGRVASKTDAHSEKHISRRIEEIRQCEACVSEKEARRGKSVGRSSRGGEGTRRGREGG